MSRIMHSRAKSRGLIGLALLALAGAALACNLRSDSAERPTAIPTRTYLPVPTILFTIPTATLGPTAFPQQTQVPPTQTNCVPFTAWTVYTVTEGDTLGAIAEDAGTTVEQLVTANCLANAELIYVGQQLYVPRLPATAIPVPTATPLATVNPNAPVFLQALNVQQTWRDSAGQAVTYYPSVRLSVPVSNATVVTFYVNDPGGAAAIMIGQDADPWDGAILDYDFPAAGVFTFQAAADNESLRVLSTVFTVRYDPGFVPPEGQTNTLGVTPYLRVQDGWTVLRGSSTVTILWRDAPVGAVRVDFTFASTGTGIVPQGIGSDPNPADGGAIAWGVPAGISGYLQGVAAMPDGSVIASRTLAVVSE